jgi:hypothetical protein
VLAGGHGRKVGEWWRRVQQLSRGSSESHNPPPQLAGGASRQAIFGDRFRDGPFFVIGICEGSY